MIKLFASDLDGTLLNAAHVLDRGICRALGEVTASGAHFAIATGRCLRTSDDFGFAGIDCEVIGANGAMILGRSSELLHYELIDPAFLEELFRAFPDVSFDFIGLRETLVTTSKPEHDSQLRQPNLVRRIVMRGMRDLSGARDALPSRSAYVYEATPAQVLAGDVVKANCSIRDEGRARELHAFVDEHASQVVDAPFNPCFFELTARGVDKGSALAWLANYLGIHEDEVAVYGDGGNDVAMLQRYASFGHAWATRGASAAAKEAATGQVGSCVLHAVPRHMRALVRKQGLV